jgi:thioredoxin reductase (NADPH)
VTEAPTNTSIDTGGITMYGTAWCQDCKRSKQFFGEHRVAYRFIDVDEDADGSVLVEPSNAALAAKLGLLTQPECASTTSLSLGAGQPA